jgi:PD-(D/E)XK nuclease superfamily protein
MRNHPVDVGDRSETAILAAFYERRYLVWLPWSANSRADMVLEVGDRFLRIQCKTGRLRHGAIVFRPQSVRCNTKQIVTRTYVGEVDYFAVYCPETRGVYVVPCDETTRSQIALRVRPTANNQNKRIRWAADYELDRFCP